MTQISVRLADELVAYVDAEVAAGRVPSRAAYVQRALLRQQRRDVQEREIEILAAIKHDPDPDLKSYLDWLGSRTYPDLDA